MRNHSFDLGRVLTKLESTSEMEFFDHIETPKWFIDTLDSLSEDEREEILHSIAFGIDALRNQLQECILIAKGHDDLNYNNYL